MTRTERFSVERALGWLRKKAVNRALRATGTRNAALNAAAVATARRLAAASDATARWVEKDALRELTSPAVVGRLSRQTQRRRSE